MPNLTTWQLTSLLDANSISINPLFVNAAGGDFHEQSLYKEAFMVARWPRSSMSTPDCRCPQPLRSPRMPTSPPQSIAVMPPSRTPTSRPPTAATSTSAPTAIPARPPRVPPSICSSRSPVGDKTGSKDRPSTSPGATTITAPVWSTSTSCSQTAAAPPSRATS